MTQVLVLRGPARERGRAYGEAAKDLIHLGIGTWRDSISQTLEIDADLHIAEFIAATSFQDAMAQWTPWVLDEIHGISEGASVPFEHILAYNLYDEESWYRFLTRRTPTTASACSVLGLQDGPAGESIIAQNMDLPAFYDGTQLILVIDDEQSPQTTVLTYAGSTGLCGVNNEGLGVCVNTLGSLNQSTRGLPVNAVMRGILTQPTLNGAKDFVTTVRHASGQAYLIGSPDALYGVECSANGCYEYGRGSDRKYHTNHPLVSDDIDERIDSAIVIETTVSRADFLHKKLETVEHQSDIEQILSDRTIPICKVPSRPSDAITFASIIMTLAAPPRIRLAQGPPDRTSYEDLAASLER